MSWSFFDFLDVFVDGVSSLSSGANPGGFENEIKKHNRKTRKYKYYTEKVSLRFIVTAAFFFFIAFQGPLPAENHTQTIIIGSLIGLAISFLLFFILHVLEVYYFKSLFKLILFSCSVIVFMISLVFCIYFKSGIFI